MSDHEAVLANIESDLDTARERLFVLLRLCSISHGPNENYEQEGLRRASRFPARVLQTPGQQ